MNDKRFTTKKVQTGVFETYWNGQKTNFEIQNGCLGTSGRDTQNVYIIINTKTGTHQVIGSLDSAKGILAYQLKTLNR